MNDYIAEIEKNLVAAMGALSLWVAVCWMLLVLGFEICKQVGIVGTHQKT